MEIKKENFKRISDARLEKILAILSQFSNLSNSSFYEYTDEEVKEIFTKIERKTAEAKEVLLKANEKRKGRINKL